MADSDFSVHILDIGTMSTRVDFGQVGSLIRISVSWPWHMWTKLRRHYHAT